MLTINNFNTLIVVRHASVELHIDHRIFYVLLTYVVVWQDSDSLFCFLSLFRLQSWNLQFPYKYPPAPGIACNIWHTSKHMYNIRVVCTTKVNIWTMNLSVLNYAVGIKIVNIEVELLNPFEWLIELFDTQLWHHRVIITRCRATQSKL